MQELSVRKAVTFVSNSVAYYFKPSFEPSNIFLVELPPGLCTLTIGGSKAYVWIMTTLFCLLIFFYDLQKILQYIFSNEDNTHMAQHTAQD